MDIAREKMAMYATVTVYITNYGKGVNTDDECIF